MAAVRRYNFNEMPQTLQDFLASGESFTEIQQIFVTLLSTLQRDLANANVKPIPAARAFVVLEHLKSEFASFEQQVKSMHHDQATKILPKLFEAEEIPEIPLNEGFKVEVAPKFFCSIKAANKCAAHQWLKDHDLGDIVQPEVNPKTLNSALQEYIQTTGEEPPQETITTYIAPVAKVKKCKGAKKLLERSAPAYAFGELFDTTT
jgi:hypothetical protein